MFSFAINNIIFSLLRACFSTTSCHKIILVFPISYLLFDYSSPPSFFFPFVCQFYLVSLELLVSCSMSCPTLEQLWLSVIKSPCQWYLSRILVTCFSILFYFQHLRLNKLLTDWMVDWNQPPSAPSSATVFSSDSVPTKDPRSSSHEDPLSRFSLYPSEKEKKNNRVRYSVYQNSYVWVHGVSSVLLSL